MTVTTTGSPSSRSLVIAIVASLVFLRALVGLHPHSGQNNHHGSKVAYGGDYEAQRHWMELTLHLDIGEWYWYDLEYWGLDYPPLTAYVSYLCGVGSALLVGPQSVALQESRGYEDSTHKTYMRATVWVLDLLLYFPAVWLIAKRACPSHNDESKSLWTFVVALSQPALLLIDHGHFQYNAVSLALALLACYHVTQPSFQGCVVGSVLFCLALNFKQMTLYYAPAIFFYLLGRCFASGTQRHWIRNIVLLAVTVLSTFGLLWWPFVLHGPTETSASDRFIHVLHRIFPFQRGLFEGKVSNLWCALSVKPFSIRERLDANVQPLLALAVTLILIAPACFKVFCVGRRRRGRGGSNADEQTILLWGMASTGLAFFLASFQVHEKSILLALAPISLLYWNDVFFVQWFSIVSTWTLWPLIQVDQLQAAYFCTAAIVASLCCLQSLTMKEERERPPSFFTCCKLTRAVVPLSYVGMMGLHVLEGLVSPPPNLPDLFPVLWSIAGCGMIFLAWLATCWHLYHFETTTPGGSEGPSYIASSSEKSKST